MNTTKKTKENTKYPHGCKTYNEYEEYRFLHPSGFRCSECGKHVELWRGSKEEYTWKIKTGKVTKYYCSYTCMRKAEKRLQAIKDKKEAAALLNKYNGALSLSECKFVEDFKFFMEEYTNKPFQVKITDRDDFINLIKMNYGFITKEVLNVDGGK